MVAFQQSEYRPSCFSKLADAVLSSVGEKKKAESLDGLLKRLAVGLVGASCPEVSLWDVWLLRRSPLRYAVHRNHMDV